MSTPGYATPEGTLRFKTRFEGTPPVTAGHFRKTPGSGGLWISSLGMGSYLGEPSAEDDRLMSEATVASVQSGAINLIDTAINYRLQCSERSIGQGLQTLFKDYGVARDEVFIASKNGFLTPDGQKPQEDFRAYFQEHFIDSGLITPDDIAGGMHCMAPGYLNDQLNRSLDNLGLETLDLMYLHNASESQLGEVGRSEFMARLESAFAFYESARKDGRIRYYGMATWECFRLPEDHPGFLNLEALVRIAQRVGGDDHGFRFIQLPLNLAMIEAIIVGGQSVDGENMNILDAAMTLGITVFTSVPLLQGQLLGHPSVPKFDGLDTSAQACLQFVRSVPGVHAPLPGHKQPAHVKENLAVAAHRPLSVSEFESQFLSPAT